MTALEKALTQENTALKAQLEELKTQFAKALTRIPVMH
jgi:hypothetical protein